MSFNGVTSTHLKLKCLHIEMYERIWEGIAAQYNVVMVGVIM